MFCGHCGNFVEDGSAFCGSCGNRIEAEEHPQRHGGLEAESHTAAPQPYPSQQQSYPEREVESGYRPEPPSHHAATGKRSSFGLKAIIIAASAVALVGGGFFVWKTIGDQKNRNIKPIKVPLEREAALDRIEGRLKDMGFNIEKAYKPSSLEPDRNSVILWKMIMNTRKNVKSADIQSALDQAEEELKLAGFKIEKASARKPGNVTVTIWKITNG